MIRHYPGPTAYLPPIVFPDVEVKRETIVGQDLSLTLRVADGVDYLMLVEPERPEWSQNGALIRACAGEGA